jgi:hypothetical protein
MLFVCEVWPDYAKPTRARISETWKVHRAGGGEMPIEHLLATLKDVSDEDKAKLADRSPMKLIPTHSNGGTFINQGPAAIEIHLPDVKIKMPKVIKGDYISFSNECQYKYESKFWMRACKGVLCSGISSVTSTMNRLTINLKSAPDQCYIFEPAS